MGIDINELLLQGFPGQQMNAGLRGPFPKIPELPSGRRSAPLPQAAGISSPCFCPRRFRHSQCGWSSSLPRARERTELGLSRYRGSRSKTRKVTGKTGCLLNSESRTNRTRSSRLKPILSARPASRSLRFICGTGSISESSFSYGRLLPRPLELCSA